MHEQALEPTLEYPFAEPPGEGELIEVAPGLLWTRIALPFRLDHVNIYFIEDGDGWAILDTGIGSNHSIRAWEKLAADPMLGGRFTRLIVSHFHPDHIGLAGWLCERFGLKMLASQTTWLGCLNISLSPGALDAKPYRDFYLEHGLDQETTELVATNGHNYLKMVRPLPPTFRRIIAGDRLRIGSREFQVLSGDGHAPEQIMLYCEAEKIFLASDQVIAKISPNVSVWAVDPDGDPLGLYLRSLHALKAGLPEDLLVLPGHQLPFYGLHIRIDELTHHHEIRCQAISEACAARPCSVADLVPVLFPRPLDAHQLSFAFSEVHAHVNFMVGRGELGWRTAPDGIMRTVATATRLASGA
jgi:glyoxylase-like metal-dependent hydrolase (beta-lactamase superfamily II)